MRTRLHESHVMVGKLCVVCHCIATLGLSAAEVGRIFKEEGMPEWNRTMVQKHTKNIITPAKAARLVARGMLEKGEHSLNQIETITGVSKSTLQEWKKKL